MAKLTEKNSALIYRIYIADALRAISNNTARNGGTIVTKRYYDIYQALSRPQKEDERTSDEIISHIRHELDELRN